MNGLIALHLIILGFWGGVVAVELLFEVGGVTKRFDARMVATLHQLTDRYLEIPLLIGVVTTGLMLWQRAGWSPELLPKALAGLGAVTANVVCVYFVERRARAVLESPALTRRVFATAIMGVPLGFTAIVLAGFRAGWW